MRRPAADIFVAGFAQSIPTMFLVGAWMSTYRPSKLYTLSPANQATLPIAFFLNAPLIVLQPLVVSYLPSLSFGAVNASLHAWLTVAWFSQSLVLSAYCTAFDAFMSARDGKRR